MCNYHRNAHKKGANVVAKGFEGWLPIHFAAYFKQSNAAQLLFENGGNDHSPNNLGFTPIDFTIMYGSESIFKLLVKNGATVRQDAIHMAIVEHCGEMIQPLIEYGLDVNENVPFHEAAMCGCVSCIDILKECIKFGANMIKKDPEGKRTFETALSNGKVNVFKFLSQNHI